jgi:hypothetical protein
MTYSCASEWLLSVGPLVKRLNRESLGDLAAPTVAGRQSPSRNLRSVSALTGDHQLSQERSAA